MARSPKGLFKLAVADADGFEERTRQLQKSWREQLGSVRANSATDVLLRRLPGAPVLTVSSAAGLMGRSFTAATVTGRASSPLEDLAYMPVEEVRAWPVGALSWYRANAPTATALARRAVARTFE